jgi:quinol monooxygenase YgiN
MLPQINQEQGESMTNAVRIFCFACLAMCACLVQPVYASDEVVVLVKVFPTLGREDELQAQYLKRVEYLRKAEPSATFRLHRGTKQPIAFLWYEVYESQAAYDNHLKVIMPAYRKETGPTPEGLLARPSESETYVEIAK